MANEFENMQTAPVLTLEPFKEEETAVQVRGKGNCSGRTGSYTGRAGSCDCICKPD